uniref:Uncharacterized protein n=1 Tax=Timema genevievae TaxID=629358 RepID=A0A7R9K960_TIMGE|nr:unnamed protein product [Timema genevievae]
MDQERRRELKDTEPTMPCTRPQQFRSSRIASYEQQCDLPQSQSGSSKIQISVTKKSPVKVGETSSQQEALNEPKVPAPICRERRLRNMLAPDSTIAEDYECPEYEYPEFDSKYNKLINEFDPQPGSKVSLNLDMNLQFAASSNYKIIKPYSERALRSSKGDQSKLKSGPESAKSMLESKRLQPSKGVLEPIARRSAAEGVALGVKDRQYYRARLNRVLDEAKKACADERKKAFVSLGLEPNDKDAAAYVRRDDPKLGYDDRYVQAYGDYDT